MRMPMEFALDIGSGAALKLIAHELQKNGTMNRMALGA